MKKVFKISGLGCANCAAKIENALKKLDGIESASVSFLMSKITVETKDDGGDGLFESVKKIVAKYEPDVKITNNRI